LIPGLLSRSAEHRPFNLTGGLNAPLILNRMLTYREKTTVSNELKNDNMIDKDRELLAKHSPTSSLLHRSVTGSRSDTLSFEIIYALLEVTTKEEILSNRKKIASPATTIHKTTPRNKEGKASSSKAKGQNVKTGEEKKSSPKPRNTKTSTGKDLKTPTSSEPSSSSATE